MDQLPVTVVFIMKDKELVPVEVIDKVRQDTFFKSLKEGDKVEVTYEMQITDGSYSQLSKVHKCARELAKETGTTFEDMKKEIKKRAGLVLSNKELKSFADCSREELSMAIQAAIEIGDVVGCNLHQY